MSDSDHDAYRSYEAYDRTSSSYDDTRVVPGLELLLEILRAAGPLAELRILDAGCGTGNHLMTLRDHIGALVGLEYSEGMLARARAKLGNDPRVQLDRGSILEMPYPDGAFDAVLFNQVLHHLDTPETVATFSGHRAALGEAARVLAPGGVLVVNTVSTEQLSGGYWYADLIPEAWASISSRFMPVDELRAVLCDELGLGDLGLATPRDAPLQGAAYADPSGPLRSAWRDGDSSWGQASEAELAQALSRVEAMLAAGTAEAFVAERDARRLEIGQSVYVFGRR